MADTASVSSNSSMDWSTNPAIYPASEEIVTALQDVGKSVKVRKQGIPSNVHKYTQIQKLCAKIFNNIRREYDNPEGLTVNVTRGSAPLYNEIVKLRRQFDVDEIDPCFRRFSKDGKVFLLENCPVLCGIDKAVKEFQEFIALSAQKKDSARTPNDGLRLCDILLSSKYIPMVRRFMIRKNKVKYEIKRNDILQFYERVVSEAFLNPEYTALPPPDTHMNDVIEEEKETWDPNDPSIFERERDGEWLMETWSAYVRNKYKRALDRWNQETDETYRTPSSFIEFCATDRWLFWIFLKDLDCNFLLAKNACGSFPRYLHLDATLDNLESDEESVTSVKRTALIAAIQETESRKKQRLEDDQAAIAAGDWSLSPSVYPPFEEMVLGLQDEGKPVKTEKKGVTFTEKKYNVLSKMCLKMYNSIRKTFNNPDGLTANVTRGVEPLVREVLKLRRQYEIDYVDPCFEPYGYDGRIYLLENDPTYCGLDKAVKKFQEYNRDFVEKRDNARTFNDGLRLVDIILCSKYRRSVKRIMLRQSERIKRGIAQDDVLQFYERVLPEAFLNPDYIATPPPETHMGHITEDEKDRWDPNDPTIFERERDAEWLMGTWGGYVRPKYKRALDAWNKETGEGDRNASAFVNFCGTNRWLFWVFLKDLECNFILAKNATSKLPKNLLQLDSGLSERNDTDEDVASLGSKNEYDSPKQLRKKKTIRVTPGRDKKPGEMINLQIGGRIRSVRIPFDHVPGTSFAVDEDVAKMEKVMISTLQAIPGMTIIESKPVIFSSVCHSYTIGGKSKQKTIVNKCGHMLQEAQEDAQDKLMTQAIQLGCNAILGMTFDVINDSTGEGGKIKLVMVTARGTPCSVVPISELGEPNAEAEVEVEAEAEVETNNDETNPKIEQLDNSPPISPVKNAVRV